MAKSDNEYLADMYKNYKPARCHCGAADTVFCPGRCEEHAEQELSDVLDKGVGGLGRHGVGGSNLTEEDI